MRVRNRLVAVGAAVAVLGLIVLAASSPTGRSAATPRAHASPSDATTTLARSPSTAVPDAARQRLSSALANWVAFPGDGPVRPLLLTPNPDPVLDPALGFPTGDAKLAFLAGLFTTPGELPAGPGEADGYPLISAADALALLRSEGSPAGGTTAPPAPLQITDVRFDRAWFGTDRGARQLPAWWFSFAGVDHPAAVLAVASSAQFPLPADSQAFSMITTASALGGRALTIHFVGAAPGNGPCSADYTVDQLASRTAVAVLVRETRAGGTPGRVVTCPAVGYSRQVTIELSAPLGNRVLVDARADAPIAVATALPAPVDQAVRERATLPGIGRATSADWVLTTRGPASNITSGGGPDPTQHVYLVDLHGRFEWRHSCPPGAPPSACVSTGNDAVFTLDPQTLQVLDFGIESHNPNLAVFGPVGHLDF